jgi:RNA polymerase sigma factor (sigma-70 family)
MKSDVELLRDYAEAGSEAAFAELVKRHVNLVYSAALRQVAGDAHLAHDVSQSVFTNLAKNARSLSRRDALTGWLYTTAHFAAAKIVRTEHRRLQREEQYMREPVQDPTPEADWEKLRPVLDAAMHELKETDREAVLLRYFENRPYVEVGAKLGINENTARMRVERALEKLRGLLAKRAIITSAGLASIISANAVQIAPSALAITLTNTSFAAAGVGTSFAIFRIMTLTQLKVGISAIVVAGAAAALVLQHQAQQRLHSENDRLRQQIAQLKTESQDLPATNSKQMTSDEFNELLRLRGEVGALRSQTNQLAKLQDENQKLQASVAAIVQTRQQAPEVLTPEQEFAQLEMSTAKQSALGMLLYANDHGDQFPTNLDQATAYFEGSNTPFTNQSRFEITYTGSLANLANPSKAIIVREVQPWRHNGTWIKVYGFGDGHAQIYSVSDGNFDELEKQHVPVLKNQ